MCYNIAFLTKRLEEYAERYKDSLPQSHLQQNSQPLTLPEYYFVSGFEHPLLPVVTTEGILPCYWGLIPEWIRTSPAATEIRDKTLNAAGETVFEKPSFRNSIKMQRCLLGINGFYEWRLFNKTKYPYYITSASGEIFSLGCIYARWTDQDSGVTLQTFSILTTAANPLMETIHNTKKRMPLIIPRSLEPAWISPDMPAEEVRNLIMPYNQNDLHAYTVTMIANHVRQNRNVPQIMEPVLYPELTLFG